VRVKVKAKVRVGLWLELRLWKVNVNSEMIQNDTSPGGELMPGASNLRSVPHYMHTHGLLEQSSRNISSPP